MESLSGENLETLVQRAREVPAVSGESAEIYRERSPLLVKRVNHLMVKREDLTRLIGENNLGTMFDNHKHHAATLAAVFLTGKHDMLAHAMPWAYRSYHARGFSYDYFPAQLEAWHIAIGETLPDVPATEILRVYRWMASAHSHVLSILQSQGRAAAHGEVLSLEAIAFRDHALQGDHHYCLNHGSQNLLTAEQVLDFYLKVIQPAMHDIGLMWERGEITVAEEHLASAVAGRVMTQLSLSDFDPAPTKGRAIITTPPGEAHELGAWMVADLLERDGWEIRYLGPHTPADRLVRFATEFKPDLLAFSVTMSIHIPSLRETIKSFREGVGTPAPKIMVGGEAFREAEDLWTSMGADGYARDLKEACDLAKRWGRPCQKQTKD